MTFLELEKECKKLKIKKLLYLLILSIFVIAILILFYSKKVLKENKLKDNKVETSKKLKSNKILVKEVNYSLKKKESNNLILTPLIDLNISIPKKENKINKNLKKEINSSKQIKSNLLKKETYIKSEIIPSFDTCINLANEFYKKKNYKKALKWAKLANLKNKKDKRSWIISAKALYKLGNKEKAIEILSIYYKFNALKEIKKLIEDMKKGKI